MKRKESEEFKKFDKTMGDLLSVSYEDLKKKLDEEKAQKEKERKRTRPNVSGDRVSKTSP